MKKAKAPKRKQSKPRPLNTEYLAELGEQTKHEDVNVLEQLAPDLADEILRDHSDY